MNIQSHIQTLQVRHDQLDQQIRREERQAGTNDSSLNQMKKRRLKLKEELTAASNNLKPRL
jgi:hypothetical protein